MLTNGNHKPGSVKMGYFALRFLFTNIFHKEWAKQYLPTSKVAKILPLVLSKDEVADVPGAIDNFKHRTPHIKKPYTPYTFKHSFATHHFGQGTNLLVIPRLMGRSDLSNSLKCFTCSNSTQGKW